MAAGSFAMATDLDPPHHHRDVESFDFRHYAYCVAITFDPAKREKALRERSIDFASAEAVFAGLTHDFEDVRRDYGETRIITVGHLEGRMMIVGWTPRGVDRHVFTMRKANEREQIRYAPLLR